MSKDAHKSLMRIKLSDERREDLLRSIVEFYADNFDEDLSEFRAQAVLDFFVKELGPPVYNQAIRDAHAYMQDKLSDLEGDIYEPEEPYGR